MKKKINMDMISRWIESEKWEVSKIRKLTKKEIKMVSTAIIAYSKFGRYVCFYLKDGKESHIMLSNHSYDISEIGDIVDINTLRLIVLKNKGTQEKIYRVLL